jgi:hypothetical protein
MGSMSHLTSSPLLAAQLDFRQGNLTAGSAASLELTTADVQEISNAIVRTGAGARPTMPQLERADASH